MTTARPVWTWIIAVFASLTSGISLAAVFVAATGILPVNEADLAGAPRLTTFDYGANVFFALVNILAAVYLLLLKKPAFYLFAALFGVGLIVLLRDALTAEPGHGMTGVVIVSEVFAFAIQLAICLYCWRLVRSGVLR